MEMIFLGLIVALNIAIIKIKFSRKRIEDGIFDVILLVIVMALFSGSYPALVVGTIGSFFTSLFLLASPPTFFSGKDGFFQEFIRRAKRSEK